MITFKQFIREADAIRIEDYVDQLCAPYYREVHSTPKLDEFQLFRGMTSPGSPLDLNINGKVVRCYTKDVRKDRKPLHTDQRVSKKIDNIFHDKFGWYPRSTAVFAVADEEPANQYGKDAVGGSTYQIIPIGKFRYLWSSDVHDLLMSIDDIAADCKIWHSPDMSDEIMESPKFWETMEELIDSYQPNNLKEIFDTKSEIMIDCSSYLAIPLDHDEDI